MNVETTGLEFRWTVSRGRDTYGYNICSLYANGRKVAACNGGGYDMKGTVLGTYLARAYADRLRALRAEDMPENSHWQPDRARVCAGKCNDEYMARLDLEIESGSGYKAEPQDKLPDDCWTCPKCGGDTIASRDGRRVDDGRYFYGLTFHDPNYDPGKATVGAECDDRTLGGAGGMTVEEAEAAGKSLGLERYQAFYKASSKTPTERHTVPSIDGACGMSCVEKIAAAIGLELQWVPGRKNRRDDIYILRDTRAA